jgi:hypothetical protein
VLQVLHVLQVLQVLTSFVRRSMSSDEVADISMHWHERGTCEKCEKCEKCAW